VSLTRAIAVAWVGALLVGGCASSGRIDTAADADPSSPHSYVVRPHDTLYTIAWRHDLDYKELARWNNLGPDFKLAVGEVLILQAPVRAVVPRPPPPAAPQPPSTGAVAAVPRVGKPVPLAEAKSAPEAPAAPPAVVPSTIAPPLVSPTAAVASVDGVQWVWPTERTSAPRPVPGGGILMFGRLGQDVRAAGAGRVVYTGSGIRGYGNLVIIKHGDTLLTSYAHNRELLVREGEEVSMGQVIAHMGTGPHQVCALYFEIRVNGRPTDPMRFLAPHQ
jgi:lipoprotein NlpD